jgi:hypothetical protein
LEEYEALIQPWPASAQNFIPLLSWHGLDQSELSKEDVSAYGPMGGGYGIYTVK